VLRAVTALWFRIEGAQDPHDDSVAQELDALVTEIGALQYFCRYFEMVKSERYSETMSVLGVTIHGEETDQFVRVLLDKYRI
jgi:hypothetical protein